MGIEKEVKTKTRYKKRYIGKGKKVEGEEKIKEVDLLVIGEPEEVDANFSKFFTAFTMRLIQNEKIAGKAIRLLFWIVSKLDMNRLEFYMDEKTTCSELRITRSTYYRWKKELEEEGIIVKLGENYFMLNPTCVVRGKGHRLIDISRKRVEEKVKREEREEGDSDLKNRKEVKNGKEKTDNP